MWNQQKDLLLLKEITVEGVLKHKAKSRERGTSWLNAANKLAPSFPHIEVTSKAVRDRYKTLEKKNINLKMMRKREELVWVGKN